jgi:hypothetical protein
MDTSLAERITLLIAGFGLAVTLVAFGLGGVSFGVGALTGSIVALANWVGFRWLGTRVAQGSVRGRGGAAVLLALKMGVLVFVCWALVVRLGVHPLGFLLGMGTFVAGILVGSSLAARDERATEGEK